MYEYRAEKGEKGEKRENKRERKKQGRISKEWRRNVKLRYSAEHRTFNTFIDVGFSTFQDFV